MYTVTVAPKDTITEKKTIVSSTYRHELSVVNFRCKQTQQILCVLKCRFE